MGTIQHVDAGGQVVALYRHEGYVAQVWDDGTITSGGSSEVEDRTVSWRAACSCGWLGDTFVDRRPGASSWVGWDEVPELEVEWDAHLAPIVSAIIEAGRAYLDARTRWELAADRQRA